MVTRYHAHPTICSVSSLDKTLPSGPRAVTSPFTLTASDSFAVRLHVARRGLLARGFSGYDGALAPRMVELPSPPGYYHDLSITQQHDFWIDNGYFNDNFVQIYSSAQGLIHLNRVLADPVLTSYYQHVVANMCVSGINNVIEPATARHIETSVVGGEGAFDVCTRGANYYREHVAEYTSS
ncbi:hypothetical protein LTS10_007867 [Elasticomyces elasticus]|nr:hypothetical protein LTS10_007867 [Elasticomyces elasticus]